MTESSTVLLAAFNIDEASTMTMTRKAAKDVGRPT